MTIRTTGKSEVKSAGDSLGAEPTAPDKCVGSGVPCDSVW